MFWDNAIAGVSNVIGKFIEDKDQANELESALKNHLLEQETKFVSYQRDNISAEINSESCLARNWRPIMMLAFVGIIVNNYMLIPYLKLFGVPFVEMAIPDPMWSLLKLGVSGYVVGRSGEKMVKAWKGNQ